MKPLCDTKNTNAPITSTDGESEGDITSLENMMNTTDILYKNLLSSGYSLLDIDNMDLFYYLHVMSEDEKPVENKKEVVYIDQIFF